MNNRDGTFTDRAGELGVAAPLDSFACGFLDFDQDGWLDLLVLPYTADTGALLGSWLGGPATTETPRLYRNRQGKGFDDVTSAMGLARPMSAMGANAADLDGDGWPDLYVGTGSPALEALMPNLLFHNQAGKRFADVTVAGGFGHLQKGHAIAFADFDGDGDLDVFAALGGAWPVDLAHDALFENPGFGNHRIELKLVGTRSSRSGIGARVHVVHRVDGLARDTYAWAGGNLSFGQSPLAVTVGIGRSTRAERVEIRWPGNDSVETLTEVPVDRAIEVIEGSSAATLQ